ncbi:MAG: cation diffusion facilitator family transporter [Desulfopila sp.]|jgi:cation diffusion facilitator family transporter|nr:cation diffusion facilitator family transporter [Desulfopila sp.]
MMTDEKSEERKKQGNLAVHVGLLVNGILALLKTGIGIAGNSPALLADGINSTSDVAYGIVMSICMRISSKPADHEHPYGHDQMESIAAVVVGAFVISTAIAIFWNSVDSVYALASGAEVSGGAAVITLWVALMTIAVKILITIWTAKIGRMTQNSAVIALAHDHKNDIFASAAAGVGIYFGMKGYPWVDPLAGAVVSLIILYTGIEILRSASADLMDTVPGKSLGRQVRDILNEHEGVKEVEEVHAHRFGPYLVMNITIGVDGNLRVREGDNIATAVEKSLIREIEFLRRVHVHYHPIRKDI